MQISLENRQTQVLSPQMMQSMTILRMSSHELSEYINSMSMENPVMEVTEGAAASTPRFSDSLHFYGTSSTANPLQWQPDTKDADSLYAQLLHQLAIQHLPKQTVRCCRILIENINPGGYLDDSLETISLRRSVPLQHLEDALSIVQSMEPAGVGARSLKECLLLQLRTMSKDTSLACQVVESHLNTLAKGQLSIICRDLGCDMAALQKAQKQIQSCTPKPGNGYQSDTEPVYIVPDVFLEIHDGVPEVMYNGFEIPRVNISSYYQQLYLRTEDADVRKYLTDKIAQVKWVNQCLDQRRSTLLRCAEAIVNYQINFFRNQENCLVPMRLEDIAAVVNLHESTISRAVRDKYLVCQKGIYALSDLFQTGIAQSSGELLSQGRLKECIRWMIQSEDCRSPKSDQKISDELNRQGYEISRRTVAKYRMEMGILPASARKKYD